MNLRLPLAAAIMAYCQAGQAAPITVDIDPNNFPASLNSAIQTGNANDGLTTLWLSDPRPFGFNPGPSEPTPIMFGNFLLRGLGNGPAIINGNGMAGRGFEIGTGGNVTFDNLTISNFSGPGIKIDSGATVTINDSTISGNSNAMDGGGIYNSGSLTLNDSTISGNTARNGGGIWSNNYGSLQSSLDILNSTIDSNTASAYGGGIHGSGSLTLSNITISGNTAGINGGGFHFNRRAGGIDFVYLDLRDIKVQDNTALVNGGGLSFALDDFNGDGQISIGDLLLSGNGAGNNGGGVNISSSGSGYLPFYFYDCHFEGNRSGAYGEDIHIRGLGGGTGVVIQGCSLVGPNERIRVENPDSELTFFDSFVELTLPLDPLPSNPGAFNNTGIMNLGGVIIDDFLDAPNSVPPFSLRKLGSPKPEAACNDFGIGTFQSLGNNISFDNSCSLNQPGDMPNTDAMVGRDPNNGKLSLLPGSPAIDAALTDVSVRLAGLRPMLPCGFKDANGLGRPQDGNGDGVFECDIGSVEVQGGPDMVAAQSSAYFDTSRNGEGVFVELIGNNQAVVAMFTYAVTGNIPTWLMGLGTVVGNSVVIDDMLKFDGGVFGAGFNAANITSTSVGGLSLVFPTCDSVSQPGKMAFQANPLRGFPDLLVNASRITNILDCNAVNNGASVAGRSGAFFDPARSGEGIFVQWLSNGKVVVIWYTYDNQGNRLWISNDPDRTTVNGTTVTATMVFPTGSTRFGENFNPSEVVLSDWGTITLGYQPGCMAMNFAFTATAPGFGTGNYNYVRLTKLDGTVCDL